MSVYVDDMEAPFGRMIMCHMIADTHRELVEMAERIGVQRKWVQCYGHAKEHFDICKAMRAKAVRLGAVEVTMFGLADIISTRRFRGEPAEMAYYEREHADLPVLQAWGS